MAEIWPYKYFHRAEFSQPDKMDHVFLNLLDEYREVSGVRFIITADYATNGHSPKSMHYLGRAVDGHFVNPLGIRLTALEQFVLAMRSPFKGIGIYTWSKIGPFLHLDNRDSIDRKIWTCESESIYRTLSAEFIKRLA